FQYSNLRIDPAQIYNHGQTHVTVDVENTGQRAGVETVQLYLHERYTPVATPVKQLHGFERVALEPGQKKSATFTLGPKDLHLLDRDMHWVVVPGTFDIMVGKSSDDISLTGTLEVKGSGGLAGYE
ncbi:MAG TPA: fibronectin type III-like domain-contianing protein, partial [Terriglobia bacterium]|nr:fibronectin type III-like domain-contianing protein [Terriglobia bacterium]